MSQYPFDDEAYREMISSQTDSALQQLSQQIARNGKTHWTDDCLRVIAEVLAERAAAAKAAVRKRFTIRFRYRLAGRVLVKK